VEPFLILRESLQAEKVAITVLMRVFVPKKYKVAKSRKRRRTWLSRFRLNEEG
jgi:hypothetical protein